MADQLCFVRAVVVHSWQIVPEALDIVAILALTLLPVMAATRDISSSDWLLEAARRPSEWAQPKISPNARPPRRLKPHAINLMVNDICF
jgi:hypothetical protein